MFARFHSPLVPTVIVTVVVVWPAQAFSQDDLNAETHAGKVVLRFGRQSIGEYVYNDSKIPRPYFAHVKTLDGRQVTRNHPPVKGKDRDDHATMHPGIWLAFGDLGGEDFWRNKARIEHKSFIQPPQVKDDKLSFTEDKRYKGADGSLVCRETFRCEILLTDGGYLLTWDSTFTADKPFAFGDQEEMGLGVRVATPIAELQEGQLTDSQGRKSAKEIWSHACDWCDYSGNVDGRRVGITLLCHPQNFRESWMHARNYGLLAVNPFGRKAMRKGEASRVEVKPGKSLRLRYGIWVHSGNAKMIPNSKRAYARYLSETADKKR